MEQKSANQKEWSTVSRVLVLLLLGAGLLWGIAVIRPMIGALVIAALIAYLLYPAVNRIKARTGWKRQHVVPLVYFLFLGGITLAVVLLFPVVARQGQGLAQRFQESLPEIVIALSSPARIIGMESVLQEFLMTIQAASTNLFNASRVFQIINTASTNLAWSILILILVYYLLLDWQKMREWVIRQFPYAYQEDVRNLHRQIKKIWQAYLRGQFLVMLMIGVLSGIGAGLIGLPKAILLGCLAGFLALIPSIGPMITLFIAVVIAWFEGSTYLNVSNGLLVVLTIVVFSGVQLIEGIWLQPQIMGKRLKMHPGIVFVAVIGALTVGTALLALIIVPLLASLALILRYLRNHLYNVYPLPMPEDVTSEAPAFPEIEQKS